MTPDQAAREVLADAGAISDDSPTEARYLVTRIVAAIVHIGADRDDVAALLDHLEIGLEHDPATRELAARLVEHVQEAGQ